MVGTDFSEFSVAAHHGEGVDRGSPYHPPWMKWAPLTTALDETAVPPTRPLHKTGTPYHPMDETGVPITRCMKQSYSYPTG